MLTWLEVQKQLQLLLDLRCTDLELGWPSFTYCHHHSKQSTVPRKHSGLGLIPLKQLVEFMQIAISTPASVEKLLLMLC